MNVIARGTRTADHGSVVIGCPVQASATHPAGEKPWGTTPSVGRVLGARQMYWGHKVFQLH